MAFYLEIFTPCIANCHAAQVVALSGVIVGSIYFAGGIMSVDEIFEVFKQDFLTFTFILKTGVSRRILFCNFAKTEI